MHPLRLIPVLIVLSSLPVPLYAGQLITTPSLTVQEQYNDNIFMQSSDRSGDFLTTVSPALAVSKSIETASANLAGGVNELVYLRHNNQGGVGYFLSWSGNYSLTPRLSLTSNLAGNKDTSASSIGANSLVISSSSEHQNYRLGETYLLSELLSSSLSVGYGRDDYNSTAYLGTRHYLANSEVDYDLGRRFPGIKLSQVLSYDRDVTSASQVETLNATLGLSKALSELWAFSLNGGGCYSYSRYPVAGTSEWGSHGQWGGVGNLSLTFLGDRLTGNIVLSQSLSPTSGTSSATQRTGGSVSLTKKFAPRLSWSLGGSYARNYSGQYQLGPAAIDERFWNLTGSLHYDFFAAPSELALDVGYTHNNTDYRLIGAQMSQNIFMVGLTWQLPRTR